NGAPSLDGGEPSPDRSWCRLLLGASMGPRLSTGGNLAPAMAAATSRASLQWGPVSRRGGTGHHIPKFDGSFAASMGPRLSTGGSAPREVVCAYSNCMASMAPRLSTGGNSGPTSRRPGPRRSFNGAPSLDGGEQMREEAVIVEERRLQWGPVSRRGGTHERP